ncbi:hypothetical protein AVEN_39458-1 [Araneus ventricosus]|uniref:Non-homologous end-joining factor 1 n=1 Tax=Araneus ventricosus TaxID=182803 RepID=A0A4Y2D7M2_ARAVE|nr:hypothetical protein AVEN_39458-1 [Araneus ventricosus]
MTGEAYDELWNLDWVAIPVFPYVMKYRFDEDGYILMVSDLAAVYAEKLDEKAIQERFQVLNPYAEMLPKVILKHVKQSVKKILAGDQAHEQTELKITLDSNKVIIQHQFNTSGVRFMFNFEPQKLSDNQFKSHILRPILLRALILDEEKAALQRKVEELEGRQSLSSSSNVKNDIESIAIKLCLLDVSRKKTDDREEFGEGILGEIDPGMSTHVKIMLIVQSTEAQDGDEKNIKSCSFENWYICS